MPEQLKMIMPVALMWVVVAVMWVIKILIERQRNAKKSENHILVFKRPTAGKMTYELIPIEVIGGQECVRYPRIGSPNKWAVHKLSEYSQTPIDYPLGKIHFVQATVQSIEFLGDDVEPLSNMSQVPVVSARALGSMIQGVTTATDEALKRIDEESREGKIVKKNQGFLWVYVSQGVIALLIITAIIMVVKNTELLPMIWNGVEDLLQGKGLR